MNLPELSVNRPVFISMVTFFLVVLGCLALRVLPVDLYPQISYPVLGIRADLKGAAPQEIEELVTQKIEDTLSTVAGVTSIRSVSREGSSVVALEFDQGTDIKFQEIQVRAKVANLRRSLPDSLSEPVIYRQDPDDTPIVELVIFGSHSASELTEWAQDKVAFLLRQIPGVGDVDLTGTLEPEVKVTLNQKALKVGAISPHEVVQALSQFQQSDPLGRVVGSHRRWVVRLDSKPKNLDDIRNTPVAFTHNKKPLFISDLGTVERGYPDSESVSHRGDQSQIQRAVGVQIFKQSGENTVDIAERIERLIPKIQESLPESVSLQIVRNNADLIRSNVADVYESLIIAGFLTVAVVLLFLRSPRSTLTTGLAIPSSIITTFAVMLAAGFTLNIMTLLALSLSVGLLVDDAIVVRENIFRHMCKPQATAVEAAITGTNEVTLAVIATTLTVVAVFLPVAFMQGTVGQFFKPFALTVVFAMLVSLWDAMTMAPLLSAHFANNLNTASEWSILRTPGKVIHLYLEKFEEKFTNFEHHYSNILKFFLKKPLLPIFVTFVSFLLAIFGFFNVKKSFLPSQLGTTFSLNLDGPLAQPVNKTMQIENLVHEKLTHIEALESWTLRAGSSFSGSAQVSATVRIKNSYGSHQTSLSQVREHVRKAIGVIPGYTLRISEPADPLAGASGGGRFSPILLNISGEDMGSLNELAQDLRLKLSGIKGIADIGTIQEEGLPEIALKAQRLAWGYGGVTADQIGKNLRVWIQGDTSNSVILNGKQVPIRVVSEQGNGLTPADLLRFDLQSKGGAQNPSAGMALTHLVQLDAGAGPALINRENRKRIVRVSANLAPGVALSEVVEGVQKLISETPLPTGAQIRLGGQADQMHSLFQGIAFSLGLGLLFIYMVLASLFESFIHPLTVMLAIPLAATGAVIALLIFALPLDLYGGIGMILLAGIVAKNSILLIDFALQKLNETKVTATQAILDTAPLRLRPIIMTSIAMIVGMIPVATGWGSGGAARQGLGIAAIGGVLSSTLLTLLVVPSAFAFMCRFTHKNPVREEAESEVQRRNG